MLTSTGSNVLSSRHSTGMNEVNSTFYNIQLCNQMKWLKSLATELDHLCHTVYDYFLVSLCLHL